MAKRKSQVILGANEVLWHYTTLMAFIDILKDGFLRTSVSRWIEEDEKPILWFSRNQKWECTACKEVKNPENGQLVRVRRLEDFLLLSKAWDGFVPVRIGIKPTTSVLHWSDLKRASGISRRGAEGLEDYGSKLGAKPWEWFGSFENVAASAWVAVELFTDGGWSKEAVRTMLKSKLEEADQEDKEWFENCPA